ncbi:MAG: hypothetical protein ACRYFS_01660 [Janthinobacterium lividum]
MTTYFKRLTAAACGLASLLVCAGCHNQQSSAPVIPVTPQQQQSEIDSNDHIPAAQKAAIKTQISQREQKP